MTQPEEGQPVKLVSACLAGQPCRYDGRTQAHPPVVRLVEAGQAVPVCPEVLGGLPTPRAPANIVGGSGEAVLSGQARLINARGEDVTDAFLAGAQATLRLAQDLRITQAILKERSPSCGSRLIHDGSRPGQLVPGQGVTTALLRQHGVDVVSEEAL